MQDFAYYPGIQTGPAPQEWRGAMRFTANSAQLGHQEMLIHDSLFTGHEAFDFASVYAWTGRTYLALAERPDLTALPPRADDTYANVATNIMSQAHGLVV